MAIIDKNQWLFCVTDLLASSSLTRRCLHRHAPLCYPGQEFPECFVGQRTAEMKDYISANIHLKDESNSQQKAFYNIVMIHLHVVFTFVLERPCALNRTQQDTLP